MLLHSALCTITQEPIADAPESDAQHAQQQDPSPSMHPHIARQFWQAAAAVASTISDAPTAQASSGVAPFWGSAPYWQDEHVGARPCAPQAAGESTAAGAHDALPISPTHRGGLESSHHLQVLPLAVCFALQCQPQLPPEDWEKLWQEVAVVLKEGAAWAEMPRRVARVMQ